MREIFFKAKRLDNGEWVQGGYSYCVKDDTHFITQMGKDHISYIGRHQKVDPNTICQYTGLTDKNGNKIWENDVVKEESCGYVGVVKYVDCEYLIDWNDFPYIRRDMMFWVKERGLKVIGTKFDNPELLGG